MVAQEGDHGAAERSHLEQDRNRHEPGRAKDRELAHAFEGAQVEGRAEEEEAQDDEADQRGDDAEP